MTREPSFLFVFLKCIVTHFAAAELPAEALAIAQAPGVKTFDWKTVPA
jgi:hypothetical protein